MRRGGFYKPRSQNNTEWKKWAHLKVKLSDFHVKPSTWEVHQFLSSYSSITSIEVDQRGEAYVVFW
jgi:hypothetical protein